MVYIVRERESTSRTLSARRLQTLRIESLCLAVPFRPAAISFPPRGRCSPLDSRSIDFFSASPSTGLTRECAGPDARDPGCGTIAGAAA
jgi:hypothetical protein